MNPSHRVVLNTIATYGGSVLMAGLTLFSRRWVLGALGDTDYDLYVLVGSIIIFITVLNSVLSTSVARHLAYAIGQGEPEEVKKWFNASLGAHFLLALGLVLIGWPIGEQVIRHILDIPADRLYTCLWVFRISLISAFVTMVSIPFIAMFTAKQNLLELAIWRVIQSVLVFILAYLLLYVTLDRLILYAIGMVAIIVGIQLIIILRALYSYFECRIVFKQLLDWKRHKGVGSFAAWNLFGGLGVTLRNQGSMILLNLYFGPKINAAFGIASQVSGQTNQLANSMLRAISPEITTSEARGDRSRVINLSLRTCKFCAIVVLLFTIPLIVEMDYILKIWLRHPPEYTAELCQLILCMFLVDRLTAGYMLAVNAHGKIAAYQSTVGGSLLLTLPLAWLFLALGFPPTGVGFAFVIMMIICSAGRIYWAKRILQIPVYRWIREVLFPMSIVASVSLFTAWLPHRLLASNFLRFAVTVLSSILVTMIVAWFLGLNHWERQFIKNGFRGLWRKMFSRLSHPATSATDTQQIENDLS